MKPEESKEIQLIVTAEVISGKAEVFEKEFQIAARQSRQEAGNLSYQLFKVLDKENNYVVIERYKNMLALQEHMSKPYTNNLMSSLPTLLTHAVTERIVMTEELYPEIGY
jgi:quinol monooxygenase YgiN